MPDTTKLDLSQIQGNIPAGFNKDHQALLFLSFTDRALAKAWLAITTGEVATAEEVADFNALFKKVHARRDHASNVVQATWMNLAFTSEGLTELGVPAEELSTFPHEFQDGLVANASDLGHTGPSAPENWRPAFRTHGTIHAIMIVAADDHDDLDEAIDYFMESMGAHGVDILDRLDGDARQDEKGHEHFGFKDGVSQPAIVGFPQASSSNGSGPLDPVQPGEFILGYPTEPARGTEPEPTTPVGYNSPPPPPPAPPSTDPGPNSTAGPDWTKDGSFLVFERLRQNVKAFDEETAAQAAAAGIEVELFRSKLVGRHKTGCPMEVAPDHPDTPTTDVGLTDPSVLAADKINTFGYVGDPDGTIVPRGAHIRKANPRDQEPPGVPSSRAHRIMRRGIAFGDSYHPTAPAGSPGHADRERGLLFLCYQSDIKRGFRFIQQTWINHPNFPQANDGADPILSEAPAPFNMPGAAATPFGTGGWITMTGGEYFFQPSIKALEHLST